MQALLDANADLEASNNFGATPLHIAAVYNENPAVVQALLDARANIEATDSLGQTPLHYAAAHNENPSENPAAVQAAVGQVLVDAGANVDAQDNRGFSPLELAIAFGAPKEVVQAFKTAETASNVSAQGCVTNYGCLQKRSWMASVVLRIPGGRPHPNPSPGERGNGS